MKKLCVVILVFGLMILISCQKSDAGPQEEDVEATQAMKLPEIDISSSPNGIYKNFVFLLAANLSQFSLISTH